MKWWLIAIVVVLAVTVGAALGLVYTWVLDAPDGYDAAPQSLRDEDKLVYLLVIGDLYAYEQDLDRARERLDGVDVEADGEVLIGYLELYLDGQGPAEDARNLARLAEALGASGGLLMVFSSGPAPTPQLTTTSPASPDAASSPFPTLTPVPAFRLAEKTAVCAGPGQPGRIAIRVQDGVGGGLAGVEIVVTWAQGEDRLFTGLRPEQGPGYADFDMMPDVEYQVALSGFGGDVAQELTSELAPGLCPTLTLAVDWRLTFAQEQ